MTVTEIGGGEPKTELGWGEEALGIHERDEVIRPMMIPHEFVPLHQANSGVAKERVRRIAHDPQVVPNKWITDPESWKKERNQENG